jgi:hypothetical protein
MANSISRETSPEREKQNMASTATTNEGTIQIHRSIAGTGAAFRVAFVPYTEDENKPAGQRSFHHLQEVRAFLKVLGLGADYIKDALRQLTAGRSARVPNVSITDKALRNAGFVNINNLARTNG